jgi:hypothetical protein
LSVLPEGVQKSRVLSSGKLNHAQLGHHYRPAEDRANRKEKQDEFAGKGGVPKSK